jgi:hypothetical protein
MQQLINLLYGFKSFSSIRQLRNYSRTLQHFIEFED